MALGTAAEVEAFADSLTKCANSIHERLMKSIEEKKIQLVDAQGILHDEVMLRLRANSLYVDAAKSVVEGLEMSQESLLGVVNKAKARIKTIEKVSILIDLVADILVLAAAAYAAKPGPIVAAATEVKDDVKALVNT
jgi:hypothetical protein